MNKDILDHIATIKTVCTPVLPTISHPDRADRWSDRSAGQVSPAPDTLTCNAPMPQGYWFNNNYTSQYIKLAGGFVPIVQNK